MTTVVMATLKGTVREYHISNNRPWSLFEQETEAERRYAGVFRIGGPERGQRGGFFHRIVSETFAILRKKGIAGGSNRGFHTSGGRIGRF